MLIVYTKAYVKSLSNIFKQFFHIIAKNARTQKNEKWHRALTTRTNIGNLAYISLDNDTSSCSITIEIFNWTSSITRGKWSRGLLIALALSQHINCSFKFAMLFIAFLVSIRDSIIFSQYSITSLNSNCILISSFLVSTWAVESFIVIFFLQKNWLALNYRSNWVVGTLQT